MNAIDTPLYIERSLQDFLREYAEMKIIFDNQDLIISTMPKEYDFTKKNLDELYQICSEYYHYLINLYIPLSDSIFETVRKSFKSSQEFYQHIAKKLKFDYRADEKIREEMKTRGYIQQDDWWDGSLLMTKIFKYDIELCRPRIFISDDSTDYFLETDFFISQ